MPWPRGLVVGASPGFHCAPPQVRDQLKPQDGLYTVTSSGNAGQEIRLIGAIREVLVAPENPQAVIDALAAAATQIVSLTLTEKGLSPPDRSVTRLRGTARGRRSAGRGADALRSAGQGLRRACQTRIAGPHLDELRQSGRQRRAQLERLLLQFLERTDPATAAWVRRECRSPATMVDRIVPATDRSGPQLGCRAIGSA